MATETGPDLSFAQQAVEDLMDDTCDILRPAVLTEEALATADVIHQGLRCSVKPTTARTRGTAEEFAFTHLGGVPAGTVGIEEGDVLRVVTSRRDPELPGQIFVVDEVEAKTMLVKRTLRLTRFEAVRRRDDAVPPEESGDPDWGWTP